MTTPSSTILAEQPSTKRPANAELYQHIPTAKIIELFNQGLSHRKIGNVLGMGPGSVGTRLRREGKVRTLKVRCQFQGGAGLKEKYRPANPCLGEFEVTPLHAPRSKYCRNCAPVAKKWLSAWNANARYKAEAEKYAKITRVNRWKRRKSAGRPCRRFGSTQPCQYRDHGKRGEGCLVTFKLKSSSQKYCEPCQQRVEAKRKRDLRENNKIEERRKDSERRKRRMEEIKRKLADAHRLPEAERRLANLREELQKQEAEVQQLRAKLGRPPTREADIAKYGPRIKELRAQRKSWGQIQSIMNRETAENRSMSGWRHLIEDRTTATT